MLKVLQSNLGRARDAHDNVQIAVREHQTDILIIAEPNKKIVSTGEWLVDTRSDVALKCINRNVGVQNVRKGAGYIILELQEVAILACYISPNIPLDQYKSEVDEIMNAVDALSKEMVIAGDFNAASPLWGSANIKSEHWADWIASKNLTVQNRGDTPTFTSGKSASFIDVTLTTQGLANKICDWEVQREESLSHHRFIHHFRN
ncbi:uncharacterized protein [Leptinotarsa decemlineata]|uniref:uncharacterized protein n=1 Tax=Leptinotarsa decemlineata TaxID=7539 RepID=UPI003D3075D8